MEFFTMTVRDTAVAVDGPESVRVEAHWITIIESDADRAALFYALDNPPKLTQRLKEAFVRSENLIANAE
jgi:hypothetical protein